MTDKQHDTRQDTQGSAGELQGRTHNRHTEQATGTRQETHGSLRTHGTAGAGAEDKRREGRKGGREERGTRMAARLGGAVEEGNEEETRQQTGSRERADRQRKKRYINI